MLSLNLIELGNTIFFCRYCGFPHENRIYIGVRKGFNNYKSYYCEHCGHKLHGSDLLQIPRKDQKGPKKQQLLSLEDASFQEKLESELEIVRKYRGFDVIAWSALNSEDEILWRKVLNNTDTSYKKIRLQVGQGLAGKAVQFEKPLRLLYIQALPEQFRSEYPIMACEDLNSAMVVPLELDGNPVGALMAADREENKYTNEDLKKFLNDTRVAVSRAKNNPRKV